MNPRILLFTKEKPYVEASGLIVTEDGIWPFTDVELVWSQGTSTVTGVLTVTTGPVNLAGNANGVATVTGNLSKISRLSGASSGVATVSGILADIATTAGFEIPYLLGLTGITIVPLVSTVAGNSLVLGYLRQINKLRATPSGVATITGVLTVTGSQKLAGSSNGKGSLRGEIFVNGIRNLAGTSNGVGTIYISNTRLIGGLDIDPRAFSYLYLAVNVGVAFNPTDNASALPGFVSQSYPDGHTRDSFWEYLYLYLSIGVGFNPTDDISTRPDFVSQTFPDGHTRNDFWEYLYIYLNIVRGFIQQGQLVIRPGFTRGPILPGASPPKQVPQ